MPIGHHTNQHQPFEVDVIQYVKREVRVCWVEFMLAVGVIGLPMYQWFCIRLNIFVC
jgi:hypothetical protein